jgi:hypothetical protein
MDREGTLQAIWDDYLDGMPRPKVNTVIDKLGMPKNMVKQLDDESARKFVFGLLTRLDDRALAEVRPFLAAI